MSTDRPAHDRLPAYTVYVVVLLSLVNITNYMDRTALSVLLPYIKADLHLSDTQLGLLVGLAFSVFYAVCGIPIARLADRTVRKNLIAIAIAIWSAMTALTGAAQSFAHLFVTRVGVGVGEAGGLTPAQSLISDYVPMQRRFDMFTVHITGQMVGLMLGLGMTGWLAAMIGWRSTFVVLGVPGLILAALVWATVREPVRGAQDRAGREEAVTSFGEVVRELWQSRAYRLIIVMTAAGGFAQAGFNQWLPTYYSRTLGMTPAEAGILLGTTLTIGYTVGLVVGGVISGRLARRDVRLPIRVGAWCAGLAFPFLCASLLTSSVIAAASLASVAGVLWNICSAPVIATLYSITRPAIRATAGAFSILLQSVLGFGLGPLAVGLISDALAPQFGADSLRYALFLPVVVVPIMAMVMYAVAAAMRDDLTSLPPGAIAAAARPNSP